MRISWGFITNFPLALRGEGARRAGEGPLFRPLFQFHTQLLPSLHFLVQSLLRLSILIHELHVRGIGRVFQLLAKFIEPCLKRRNLLFARLYLLLNLIYLLLLLLTLSV